MEPIPREILEYRTTSGRCPFAEWLCALRDFQARKMIEIRINRFRLGNLGLNRYVGDGVFEMKISLGPGYRVYFAQETGNVILLLAGGDKGSQERDIEQSKAFFQDYLQRKSEMRTH